MGVIRNESMYHSLLKSSKFHLMLDVSSTYDIQGKGELLALFFAKIYERQIPHDKNHSRLEQSPPGVSYQRYFLVIGLNASS